MESRSPSGRGAEWRGLSDEVKGPLSLSDDVAGASVAILPVGATEQHGSVLPLGMDWITAVELALEVARQIGAYLLPPLPIGTSMEHRGSPGTVWLRPATLAHAVVDIADSLSVWGMTRLAVLSAHGGNFILGPTIRQLNTENPDRHVVLVPESVKNSSRQHPPGDDLHVGTTETSIGTYLFGIAPPGPEADFVPNALREDLNHTPLLDLSPSGVWGRPSAATSEEGERALRESATNIVGYLQQQFHLHQ